MQGRGHLRGNLVAIIMKDAFLEDCQGKVRELELELTGAV
jgi:hypothetical protein